MEVDTFSLTLTGMAHGGAALGRHAGRVIFVPYALPGERVQVTITEDKGRYAFARLLTVESPAPERTTPLCPYFGPDGCGGCHWQHVDYRAQLRLKAEILQDQLTRIGHIADPPVRATLPDDHGLGYRNRARFHPAPDGGLGFQAATGNTVVSVADCLLLHPSLADLYAALDAESEWDDLLHLSLRAGIETGDRMLIFEMEDDLPPALETDIPLSCALLLSDGGYVGLIGDDHITEMVNGYRYRISPPSFFQVNTAQAGFLMRLVLNYLDLRGHETVLDAYCGVGLFTLPLAERAGMVVGVERAPTAVADLLENSAAYDNVEIIEGAVEAVLPELDLGPDVAVVDPPRTGLARRALDALAAAHLSRLVYVSCDPATLARDARRLIRAGYRLVEVQPVDMFPNTYHVESVSLFVSKG